MDTSENIFLHSRPISAAEARKVGSFSALPVRINLRADLADDAASKVLKDWKKYIGDGKEKAFHIHAGPLRNLNAFVYPEALPEQFRIVTYLTDFGVVFHGKTCHSIGPK